MKTKFWTVAVALLALVLCGAAMLSYAQEAAAVPEAGWHGHGQHHMGWMAKELNLTDAQKAQIKTMMQSQRATMRPLMQQLAENRKAMLAATANGAFDQAKVTAIANQQAQLMAQLIGSEGVDPSPDLHPGADSRSAHQSRPDAREADGPHRPASAEAVAASSGGVPE